MQDSRTFAILAEFSCLTCLPPLSEVVRIHRMEMECTEQQILTVFSILRYS